MKNFYPRQYLRDNKLKIKHNYLSSQFANYKKILKDIEIVIKNNDFTLGKKVDEFEKKIATLLKTKYVVSLGSGTDALMLSLKALGIKENDEVITTPFTFYATIGAIVTAGARPVFVDVKDDYNIDVKKIESAITEKTKAIVPVHWAGRICDMDKIIKISKKFKIPIVEDACHAILAKNNTHLAGTFGSFGCFSLHPLKNLNVWGDGGFVLCANKKLYNKMKLLRNHGLISRDKNLLFGYNSRLDTIQAVVAINLLKKIKYITKSRIRNSYFLDTQFSNNNSCKNFLVKVNRLYEYSDFTLIQTGSHYKFPIHDDTPNKLLSGVIYLKPEVNKGTLFYKDKQGNEKKEIEWRQNRAVFFARSEKQSWHSYEGDKKSARVALIFNLMTTKIFDVAKYEDSNYLTTFLRFKINPYLYRFFNITL